MQIILPLLNKNVWGIINEYLMISKEEVKENMKKSLLRISGVHCFLCNKTFAHKYKYTAHLTTIQHIYHETNAIQSQLDNETVKYKRAHLKWRLHFVQFQKFATRAEVKRKLNKYHQKLLKDKSTLSIGET